MFVENESGREHFHQRGYIESKLEALERRYIAAQIVWDVTLMRELRDRMDVLQSLIGVAGVAA